MELDILQPPPCEHLHKGTCILASDILGTQILVTAPVCNVTCQKKLNGPYCGRQLSDQQLGEWAKGMLGYAWANPFQNAVQKVAQRYAKPFDVHIPEIAADVRREFAPVMEHPWAKSLALTGSILSKDAGMPKDLDVLLVVNDMRAFVDDRPTLEYSRTINGLRVDLFASQNQHTFFMALDLSSNTLYKSGLYNIREIDPRITVVDTAKEIYATFRDVDVDKKANQGPRNRRRRKLMATSGPAWWLKFHGEKHPTRKWLEEMVEAIDCDECKANFKIKLGHFPPPFDPVTGELAGDWDHYSWFMHDQVNIETGNRQIDFLGYQAAKEHP